MIIAGVADCVALKKYEFSASGFCSFDGRYKLTSRDSLDSLDTAPKLYDSTSRKLGLGIPGRQEALVKTGAFCFMEKPSTL